MTVKAGYKGDIYLGAVRVAGGATWAYGGSVRAMLPKDEFGDEIVTDLPGQITGGEITISGNYLMFEDSGQQLLKTLFDSGDPITDVKLYTSKVDDHYMTPDDSTTPASYVTITNYDNVSDDKSGVATFTCTMKVSGKLKPVY